MRFRNHSGRMRWAEGHSVEVGSGKIVVEEQFTQKGDGIKRKGRGNS